MRKRCNLLFVFILLFPISNAFADVAAIKAADLPQESAVLAALDDAKQLEPYSHAWAAQWQYAIPQSEVATRLGKDLGSLNAALKNHPDNVELALLTGLVASYAYNLDVEGSHEAAMSSLEAAQRLRPLDVRALWFRARLQCQTKEMKTGAEGFLALESGHAWDSLPAAFWQDYSNCATIANLPAHTLRAVDHLKKLDSGAPSRFATEVNIARGRFAPFDPKKKYEAKEAWTGNNFAEDTEFTSTACGVRLRVHGTWQLNQLGLENRTCVAYLSTGPYKATNGELRPSLLLMVKQPEANQTLEDFARKYSTKGSFEAYPLTKCPAVHCVAQKQSQQGMYGKNGDGHGRIVVFERDEPEFPGLIFESPSDFPKTDDTAGPKFYRPAQVNERIPGKLYYLLLLDTASSIEEPAVKDFEFFVQNLTVE